MSEVPYPLRKLERRTGHLTARMIGPPVSPFITLRFERSRPKSCAREVLLERIL